MRRIILFIGVTLFLTGSVYAADPVISSFTAVGTGTTVNFTWAVTDADGDLASIKIYKARDDIGAPREWESTLAYTETVSGSSDSGTGSNVPGDGIWWYGLKVTDAAGNFTDFSYYPEAKQVNLETNTCTDADGDHYFSQSSGCSNRAGFLGHSDCDDTHTLANIDRPEICNNSIDDDCDGTTDELACVGTTIYYIKNSGNDSNSGLTDALAWKTLAKAESTVGAGAIILLNRGDTWREGFIFPAANIEINAYGTGAKPIILGSESVTTSWTPHATLSNIYQTAYAGDIDNVLHNHTWLHIAHEPDGANAWYTRDGSANEQYKIMENGDLTDTYNMTYSEAQITAGNGALVGQTFEFKRSIYNIESYHDGAIYLEVDRGSQAVHSFVDNGYYPQPDHYWLINTITYLDTTTEWFADGTNIYVYSASAPTGSWDVITREYGFYADTKDDIKIRNIEIREAVNGMWLEHCHRFIVENVDISYIGTQLRRDGYLNTRVSHGIRVLGGGRTDEEGLIKNCNIDHILEKGVDIFNFHDVTIDHCTFEEIATCTSATEAFEPMEGFLFAVDVGDDSGVGTKAYGATITNNYCKEAGGGFARPVKDSVVTHNTAIHTTKQLTDIGAIYRGGPNESNGMTVDSNYIIMDDVGTSGIYSDASSYDGVYTNNIVIGAYRCLLDHGGANNIWHHNICLDSTRYGLHVSYSPGMETAIRELDFHDNVFSTKYAGVDYLFLRSNVNTYSSDVPRNDWFKALKDNQYYPEHASAFYEKLYSGTIYNRSFTDWVSASGKESGSSIAKYSFFPTGTVSPTNYTAATPVTSTTIQAAIDSVTMAGDTVTIPCGTYDVTDITATMYIDEDQDCTEANPCILQAETNGCVTFTGDLPSPVFRIGDYVNDSTSGADHWIFKGFVFEDVSEAEGSNNKTIGVRINGIDVRCTELKFTGFAKDEDSVYSYPLDYCIYPNENCTDGEIDHCYVSVPQDKALISLHQFYDGSIHDNYFTGTQDAQCNAFQIGESYATEHDYNAVIEDNFFQSNAHIKASSITIKNNTFTGRGSVTIRAGKDNIIDRNYFLDINGSSTNTQCGVRIHDSENTFSNNYMDGVTCGYAVLIPGRNSNDYDVADNTTIIGNTILDFADHAIFLGYAYGDGSITAEYPDNVDFINNIIIADGSEEEVIQYVGATNVSFTTCQHYAANGASYWAGGTEITSGITKANPNFTTETSNTYTLNILPASNNGTYNINSLYDVFDATRNNPPDLGAIEYNKLRTAIPLLASDVGLTYGVKEMILNFSVFTGTLQ